METMYRVERERDRERERERDRERERERERVQIEYRPIRASLPLTQFTSIPLAIV
jgi:hypothetical protein